MFDMCWQLTSEHVCILCNQCKRACSEERCRGVSFKSCVTRSLRLEASFALWEDHLSKPSTCSHATENRSPCRGGTRQYFDCERSRSLLNNTLAASNYRLNEANEMFLAGYVQGRVSFHLLWNCQNYRLKYAIYIMWPISFRRCNKNLDSA